MRLRAPALARRPQVIRVMQLHAVHDDVASPRAIGASSPIARSTAAAGIISQTTRGLPSAATRVEKRRSTCRARRDDRRNGRRVCGRRPRSRARSGEALDHVRAHSSESEHPYLHRGIHPCCIFRHIARRGPTPTNAAPTPLDTLYIPTSQAWLARIVKARSHAQRAPVAIGRTVSAATAVANRRATCRGGLQGLPALAKRDADGLRPRLTATPN